MLVSYHKFHHPLLDVTTYIFHCRHSGITFCPFLHCGGENSLPIKSTGNLLVQFILMHVWYINECWCVINGRAALRHHRVSTVKPGFNLWYASLKSTSVKPVCFFFQYALTVYESNLHSRILAKAPVYH
jgi:hypothetical protein